LIKITAFMVVPCFKNTSMENFYIERASGKCFAERSHFTLKRIGQHRIRK